MPKIRVSKEVTVGVGKFESVKIMAAFEADYDQGKTTSKDAYAYAWRKVDDEINQQLLEVQDIAKPDSVFLTQSTKSAPTGKRR